MTITPRVLTFACAFATMAACKSSDTTAKAPPTTAAVAKDPSSTGSAKEAAGSAAGAPVAAPDATAVKLDFVTTNEEQTRYAGRAIDFNGDWKALHETLKREAKRLMQPTANVPTPREQITLWIYDTVGTLPDLKTTEENAIPSEHLLARYGNTLGNWQYCFAVTKESKCIFENEPVTPTTYDPTKP